jgi:hypothetical protein
VALALLLPGLLAAGAGMGLCVTPLTSLILGHSSPEHAGAVSGAMSTMQQVGNALGVAVTGVIYFGAVHGGVGRAFVFSTIQLAGLLTVVAVMTRLLPSRQGTA